MTTFYVISLVIFTIAILYFIISVKKNRKKKNLQKIERALHAATRISFSKDLPFTPCSKQIIYVEDSYNEPLNRFISKNINYLSTVFGRRGYKLIFLPKINSEITIEKLSYFFAHLKIEDITYDDTNILKYSDLFKYIIYGGSLKAGFIRYKSETDLSFIFSYYECVSIKQDYIKQEILKYLEYVGDPLVFYDIEEPEGDEIADFKFCLEAQRLISEIAERVARLQQIGINQMALKKALQIEQKLSKVTITKEYRIILNDYDKEIILHPLEKAVYLLFLKYPNGILFKNLSEYRTELIKIYLAVSNREQLDKMEKSIYDITDPTKNSINEKCSRIREAFINVFDISLASNYIITGDRGREKKIILDRSLVTFEK